MKRGDPEKTWEKIERALVRWEMEISPARWKLWRNMFLGREGIYVAIRFLLLIGSFAVACSTSWHPILGFVCRLLATVLSILLLIDILLVHVSIAFVSGLPVNLLRSATLGMLSFFQLALCFSVFLVCAADSFSPSLSWHSALYFGFVSATTLGDGDIHAKTVLGEALIVIESLLSVGFLVVLIARLISLTTATEAPALGGIKAAARKDEELLNAQSGSDAVAARRERSLT
ncbi:MAG: potassium channel family protein [Pyrinomonadaceae bacterium]